MRKPAQRREYWETLTIHELNRRIDHLQRSIANLTRELKALNKLATAKSSAIPESVNQSAAGRTKAS